MQAAKLMSQDVNHGGLAEKPKTRPSLIIARMVVGLVPGLALYALDRAFEARAWPATDGLIFAPLLVTAIFVPAVVVSSLGNLRPRNLTIWAVAAIALCASLAYYDIFRDPSDIVRDVPRTTPSPALWLALGGGIFIVHSMIAAGGADRRFIATYPRNFDLAWKHAVQLAFAACFVGVFSALLVLGAELFRLIKIEFLAELLRKHWFSIPAMTLAFTYAIHVTDARADLVRGAQTLALTLLSWLLPILTLMAVAFLLALPFTGLEPLWSTRRATGILLGAAAALAFLINAAYQDLRPENPVVAVIRFASIVAAVILVPLVALATYGLTLRVEQDGWTPERIIVSACIAVGACLALGYLLAVVRPRAFPRTLETTNIVTAFVILGAILALLTPIADPARISVADQVARLESGRTPPERFDFAFLQFGSGRYGVEALERLKQKQDGPNAARISPMANEALDRRTREEVLTPRLTPEARSANITVLYPKGQSLPMSFLQQDWSGHPMPWMFPRCLIADTAKCEAIMIDLDDDGKAELLIFDPSRDSAAFKGTADERWVLLGPVQNLYCPGIREAVREGKFQLVQPQFKELAVNKQRLRIATGCP
jgi:hypothetical protein